MEFIKFDFPIDFSRVKLKNLQGVLIDLFNKFFFDWLHCYIMVYVLAINFKEQTCRQPHKLDSQSDIVSNLTRFQLAQVEL